MDEARVYLARPEVVQVGRHRIKITPPNLGWWLQAMVIFKEMKRRVVALQETPKVDALTLAGAFRNPSLAMLNLWASTTDKRPRLPWQSPASWFISNFTPQELAIFAMEWMRVVNFEEMQKLFTEAGEMAGLRNVMSPTSAGSPARSSCSSPRPAGE